MLPKAGNETYKYDVYNRLVEYLLDDGSKSESYTYDAEETKQKLSVEDILSQLIILILKFSVWDKMESISLSGIFILLWMMLGILMIHLR